MSIRDEWFKAHRSKDASQIAHDEAFGKLERGASIKGEWNVIPIVVRDLPSLGMPE